MTSFNGEGPALVVGVQIMAIIAGVFINVLGWLVGANYYIASLPFFAIGIFAWPLYKAFHHEEKRFD